MTLKTKYKGWMYSTVVLPLFLLLIILNAMVFWVIGRLQSTVLGDGHSRVTDELNGLFTALTEKIQGVGDRKETRDILNSYAVGGRALPKDQRMEKIAHFNRNWGMLTDENDEYKDIKENAASGKLGKFLDGNPIINRAYLTDSYGAVVAMDRKTPSFYYGDEPWVTLARETPIIKTLQMGRLFSDGINHENIIGLGLPLYSQRGNLKFEGILRLEVRLAKLNHELHNRKKEGPVTLLMGRKPWYLSGDRKLFETYTNEIFGLDLENLPESGWMGELFFETSEIEGQIVWDKPLKLLTFAEVDRFDAAIYKPLFACIM